jgi:hypothetical protein
MPKFRDDFLDLLDREIVEQRQLAARAVDRADALVTLRSYCVDLSTRLNRRLTADDVFYKHARDERERAELRSLADRIDQGGEPASEGERGGGRPLDSGAEL